MNMNPRTTRTILSILAAAVAARLLTARPGLSGSYHIYPMDDGGLLFEFVHAGWDYSTEIEPQGAIEIYGVQVDRPREVDTKGFETVNDEHEAIAEDPSGSRDGRIVQSIENVGYKIYEGAREIRKQDSHRGRRRSDHDQHVSDTDVADTATFRPSVHRPNAPAQHLSARRP
jgi:hypothetical protein